MYVNVNPELTPHPLYRFTGPHYESDRVIFTRLRLSSHDLAIEKVRWSRIPRENRLCPCGHVQTEEHIVCYCTHSVSGPVYLNDVLWLNIPFMKV